MSLEDRQGYVNYNPLLIGPEILVQEIENMGFSAEESADGVIKRTTTATLTIKGMTGYSAVESIMQKIGLYTGVQSVEVRFIIFYLFCTSAKNILHCSLVL